MTGQEAREAAGADRDPVLLQDLAQFVQEDLWPGLIGLQDQRGMSLDAVRALIAALALGREVPLARLLPGPAADADHAHPKPLGGLVAGRA